MVVGLGALGIVSRADPGHRAQLRDCPERLRGPGLGRRSWRTSTTSTSAAYSVSLFTDWSGTTVGQVWLKNRADRPCCPPDCRNSSPARRPRRPGTRCPACPRSNCTAAARRARAVVRPARRTSGWTSRPATATSCSREYLIPREHAVEAHRARCAACRRSSPPAPGQRDPHHRRRRPVAQPATTAGDGIGLHFTWRRDEPAVSAMLPPPRGGAGPVRRPAALGQALPRRRRRPRPALSALCRLHRPGRPAGSGRKVPQRVPGPHGIRPLIVSR